MKNLNMSRMTFLKGALASVGVAGCRPSFFGAKPDIAFGVISDIHVTTPESTEKFRRALRYFRSRGADAVLVAGDLTDWGLKSGFNYLQTAWAEEMAGTGIVPLFVTGNHDYDGWWYGDMTLDMHTQGYSEDDAIAYEEMKPFWEKTFGEKFDGLRRRTVKGFDFISTEWNMNGKKGDEATAKWLLDHANELKGSRPFFFFRHVPLAHTVPRGSGEMTLTDVLQKFPNAVAFTGHTHVAFYNERSIWQDGFTAISVPSLSYTSIEYGHENGSGPRNSSVTLGMQKLPSRPNFEQAQGYFVQVFQGRMEVERHDFDVGEDTAKPWIVPMPLTDGKPYTYEAHAKRTPVPQFASGTIVKTGIANSDMRSGRWSIFVTLDFPTAQADEGRVFDYEARVIAGDGKVFGKKMFLSPSYYKPLEMEPARQKFYYNAYDLPETGTYRFEVVARNSFGAESRPIYSKVFTPKPGKDKVNRPYNTGK